MNSETTLKPTLENPRHYRIAGTTSFFAKDLASGRWFGISHQDLENPRVQSRFERNDREVEAAALASGMEGYWLTDEWTARVIEFEKSTRGPTAGAYFWDRWQESATAAGIPSDLADLGRTVMREAINHGWCDELQHECGVPRTRFGLDGDDAGAGMLFDAEDSPERCRARWRWLLETDGLRIWDGEEMSPYDLEWNALWAVWLDENFPVEDESSAAALRRNAYNYILEFHDLDQLAPIDVYEVAFFEDGTGRRVLYGQYDVTVSVWTEPRGSAVFYPKTRYRGTVRLEFDVKHQSPDFSIYREVMEGEDEL